MSALKLPSGARFYRCALQVNPFEYLGRHKKQSLFKTETDYNNAVIQACQKRNIEVVAVTDHYRVRSSKSLVELAKAAGIHVFPGFEAVTKDGVHFLCLFDPTKDLGSLERVVGDCGIHDHDVESPTGKYDALELLEESRKWGAACVAAHVAGQGGLLATLSGQSRMNAWTSPHLLACSLPGPVSDAPENLRQILENKNAEHRRDRPLAIINAQDVCSPDDFEKPGVSCWIKMSEVSVEGLRQAFLDPESRVRLASDPPPEDHAEFVTLAWQGGFLDGAAIHLNENLNVLVGGRGTGKSTVIESLRYVLGLEPLGEEARKAHEGIVQHVLRSGTKISLLLRSHRPNKQDYRVERTIPNPPIVRDQNGNVLNRTAAAIVPQIGVFGQHEISELTKSPEKLTRLLERFVERDATLDRRKADVRRQIEQSRGKILDTDKESAQVEERLASLPALEETLKQFQEAGLEDRLKEQSLLVREEQVLKTSADRVDPYRQILEDLRRALPVDRTFVSQKALDGLPGKEILGEIDTVLVALNRELEAIAKRLQEVLDVADSGLGSVRSRWEERKKGVQAAYEKILRELQKSKVDGEEFIHLRRQIEELRPLRERQTMLQRAKKEYEDLRRNLLAEWEDVKAEEFRQLERAAKKVNRQLAERVRVQVTFAGNREPLFDLLKNRIGGRLSEALDALRQYQSLSLKELADAWREGRDALAKKYKIPPGQADRIAQAPSEVVMQVEELDLAPTTQIELNVAGEGQPAQWQRLEDLSTGQKATAVLLLLLLESDAPLVVDQPEDDLDNRFITEGVVPKMREEKGRRQFVFATHNANIPVLGDADLIVGLTASGEAGQEGKARIPREHMGSIDARSVRELVEEVLEGGRAAFEMRRLKYGF
ncbi:MAG: AAA family ATPase [Candidatus Tectomicrobia bacterium]|nr:AAA family ATPase [Candidatus Tectomicrobia bacterium]